MININSTPDQVLPGLWLGSKWVEYNFDSLQSRGITHVLQIGHGLRPSHPGKFVYKTILAYDYEDEDLFTFLKEHRALEFIDQGRQAGGVFVHCHAGVSRSPTAVVAYIMWKDQVSLQAALRTCRAARFDIDPNDGFMMQLEIFEKQGADLSAWKAWVHPTHLAEAARREAERRERRAELRRTWAYLLLNTSFVVALGYGTKMALEAVRSK